MKKQSASTINLFNLTNGHDYRNDKQKAQNVSNVFHHVLNLTMSLG